MQNNHYQQLLLDKTEIGLQGNKIARADSMSPHFHAVAPSGWMNDPNGFSIYQGRYHLYYQYNPTSPSWGDICWGHIESEDLVFWKHCPVAIAPSEEYDIDGIHSGSAIEVDGQFMAFYTGHRYKSGIADPMNEDMDQCQCVAVGTPYQLEKSKYNPLIKYVPGLETNHFRDPKVWADSDKLYMIVGGTDGKDSHIPLFSSANGIHWTFQSILLKGEHGRLGTMWECPDLFCLNGKAVLIGCPMNINSEWKCSNSYYIIGHLINDGSEFIPDTNLTPFDYGNCFYAPQTLLDRSGRRIMIGWIKTHDLNGDRSWNGSMSLPRELQLIGDRLLCPPITELKTLRLTNGYHEVTDLPFDGQLFTECATECHCEILIEIQANPNSVFEILCPSLYFRFHALTPEQIAVTANNADQEVRWQDTVKNDIVIVHIFIDGSIFECFFNSGESSYSTATQIAQNTFQLNTICGEVMMKKAQMWRLKSIWNTENR